MEQSRNSTTETNPFTTNPPTASNATTTTSTTTTTKTRTATTTASPYNRDPKFVPDQWEELHGNYILRPTNNLSSPSSTPPRALIHFLGGAFIGAAPDIDGENEFNLAGGTGKAVAMNGQGTTIAVGSNGHDDGGDGAGNHNESLDVRWDKVLNLVRRRRRNT